MKDLFHLYKIRQKILLHVNMSSTDVNDLSKRLGYFRFSNNKISTVHHLFFTVPAQEAHVNRWQRSLLNVLRAWSKKIKGGLHADFPWELCLKWRWSLKYIGKLRTLLKVCWMGEILLSLLCSTSTVHSAPGQNLSFGPTLDYSQWLWVAQHCLHQGNLQPSY